MKFQKSIFKGLLLAASGSFIAFNCCAAETQTSDRPPIEIIKPFEMKNLSVKKIDFDAPPFGVEHQVRLQLEVCAPCGEYGAGSGSNPVLEISVNGNSIAGEQLVNKPVFFKYNGDIEFSHVSGTSWRVLYAKDFEMIPDYATQYPGDPNPYLYIFDITKFTKSSQKNELIIKYNHSVKDITLKVRNLKLAADGKFMHPKGIEKVIPAPTGVVPAITIRGKQQEPMKVFLSDAGAIYVEMCNQKYTFLTKTSIPGGSWKTTADSSKGKYVVKGSTGAVEWKTPYYSITRKLTVKDDHIYVSDTISNTSDKLIGLWLATWINHQDKAAKYLLGGREVSGNASFDEIENPSVCVQAKDGAIGIIPESDIFQAHINLFKNDAQIGIEDRNLGIESGKSVTMEWSIYPVAKGGYWDFVNAIRRNWDVNYTVPGPFAFVNLGRMEKAKVDERIEWIKAQNIRMICDSIPVYNMPMQIQRNNKYGDPVFSHWAHGTASLLGTDFLSNVEYARELLKKTLPGLEYFFYFHAQCSTLENGPRLYDDSIIYDSKGNSLCYYSIKCMELYLPTLNNKYGKALWAYVELVVDKMNMNMYWDESAYSMQRIVYNTAWDGCSVELDAQFNVARKITCVPLSMQPFNLKVVSYVKSKGKKLLTNSQAATATMREEKLLRFVETASYDNIYKSNLGCIIGLATNHPEKNPADAYAHVYNFLKRGGLYYADSSIPAVPENYFVQYMFPTTPVEIYAGIIFGKERIITCKSGSFSLPEDAPAQIVAVSPEGLVVDHAKLVKEIKTGNRYKYEVRIPSNYIVILIKKIL